MWSGRTKLHIPHHCSVRVSGKHNHNNYSEIRKHCGVFTFEWESSVNEAMGLRVHGVLWIVVSDLPQVEEAAKNAEEEEVHLSKSDLLLLFL